MTHTQHAAEEQSHRADVCQENVRGCALRQLRPQHRQEPLPFPAVVHFLESSTREVK